MIDVTKLSAMTVERARDFLIEKYPEKAYRWKERQVTLNVGLLLPILMRQAKF